MKTLFITGGAKRLGREIALKFAKEGFDVCFTYLTSEKEAMETKREIEKLGRKCMALKGNLGNIKTILKWRDEFFKNFEKCDCLINSAGIFYKTPLREIEEKDFDEIINVNLKAPLFISKYFSEKMLEAREGVIINIADVAGSVTWRNYIAYSISKDGLIMLTKILAKELAPYIRVCGVAPGPVLMPEYFKEEERKRSIEKTLLKRVGKPENIADTCYFIYKNDYITGTIIYVDGGRSVV
jgi:NAD(P)-dependent dehydrogenase (short-subunit alcohol dehydrogenase family)